MKNLKIGDDEEAGGSRIRKEIGLVQSISGDTAREIVKAVKAQKFKKVQVAIQGDQGCRFCACQLCGFTGHRLLPNKFASFPET